MEIDHLDSTFLAGFATTTATGTPRWRT